MHNKSHRPIDWTPVSYSRLNCIIGLVLLAEKKLFCCVPALDLSKNLGLHDPRCAHSAVPLLGHRTTDCMSCKARTQGPKKLWLICDACGRNGTGPDQCRLLLLQKLHEPGPGCQAMIDLAGVVHSAIEAAAGVLRDS